MHFDVNEKEKERERKRERERERPDERNLFKQISAIIVTMEGKGGTHNKYIMITNDKEI